MNLTEKVAIVLSNSRGKMNLLLSEEDRSLVNFAAALAVHLHIRPEIIEKVLDGAITEDGLNQHMTIAEEQEPTRVLPSRWEWADDDNTGRPYATKKNTAANNRSDRNRPGGPLLNDPWLSRHEAEFEKEMERRQAAERQKHSELEAQEEQETAVDSKTMARIRNYADQIVSHVMRLPGDERSAKIRELVNTIIATANLVIRGDDRPGKAFQVSRKYRPETGIDQSAAARQPSLEHKFLEKAIINEIFDAFGRLVNRWFGGRRDTDVASPDKTTKYSIDQNTDPIERLARDIVLSIYQTGANYHGSLNIINNVLKYIMKQTGVTKLDTRSRQDVIDSYVQKIFDVQKGKPEKGFTVNISKLPKQTIIDVLRSYKAAIRKRGYDAELISRYGGKVVEFILRKSQPSKTPTADKMAPGKMAPGKMAPDKTAGSRLASALPTIGYLMKRGRKPVKIIGRVDRAFVYSGGKWQQIPERILLRLLDGEKVDGWYYTDSLDSHS